MDGTLYDRFCSYRRRLVIGGPHTRFGHPCEELPDTFFLYTRPEVPSDDPPIRQGARSRAFFLSSRCVVFAQCFHTETLFGRDVHVETSSEIVAKKVWHRGDRFTARDIFDLAMVAEKEPGSLLATEPILQGRRDIVLGRISAQGAALREAFDALEALDYRRSFDDCVAIVKEVLA